MHPSSTHTSSQLHAFPKGQASPGERASAGWAVRGEFSSISSPQSDTGWWPPVGEKGLEGVAGAWGSGRGSSGLAGSSSPRSPVGLPVGLPLGSASWGRWSRAGSSPSSSASSSSSISSSSASSLMSSHSSPSPSSPSPSPPSPSSPSSSGGRWAGTGLSGGCEEHKAGRGKGVGPGHPHITCPEMTRRPTCVGASSGVAGCVGSGAADTASCVSQRSSWSLEGTEERGEAQVERGRASHPQLPTPRHSCNIQLGGGSRLRDFQTGSWHAGASRRRKWWARPSGTDRWRRAKWQKRTQMGGEEGKDKGKVESQAPTPPKPSS